MSCHWGVYCIDCDKVAGIRVNHGEELCQQLVHDAAHIAALARAVEQVPCLDVNVMSTWGSDVDVEWFLEHEGHRLAARNEYGEFAGACSKRVDCLTCGASHSCTLPVGHEGSCSYSGKKS